MNRVCIMWLEGMYLCWLKYWNGKIRTFPGGNNATIDSRIGPTQLVEDEQNLWEWLLVGERCRVPVKLAREVFGLRQSRFALN